MDQIELAAIGKKRSYRTPRDVLPVSQRPVTLALVLHILHATLESKSCTTTPKAVTASLCRIHAECLRHVLGSLVDVSVLHGNHLALIQASTVSQQKAEAPAVYRWLANLPVGRPPAANFECRPLTILA